MATPEKIYKCGHCGTTNDSLESLKQHMLDAHMSGGAIHTGNVNPILSEASTSSIVSEPKHMEESSVMPSEPPPPLTTLPGPDIPKEKPPGKFKCGHCGIIVSTMDKLKSHMLTTHVSDQAGQHANQQHSPMKG